jgi:hypothetical protein
MRGETVPGPGFTRVRRPSTKDYKGFLLGAEGQMMETLKILGALAVLAAVGSTFAASIYPQTARAQTQGMDRRDDRRDTRQDSRNAKQACKAGDEKSRADCRQEKHEVKQAGRQGETPAADPAKPATTAPPDPPH